ncbi:hypothetical protein [Sphingomonas aquatilis]|uniref:hypothetical protein n=1 Tax=Sphingomonas aquatilis TaxID=93063 RepID=UPI0023F61E1A|nr:hypothetical protein [Sphingomonas aquatilis]MCI4653110.1 hypothetical protein [Sphingomonas aquatilis]
MADTRLMVDECERVSAALDPLIARMRNGRSPLTRHGDDIDQVEALGLRLIAAARGPGRSINPPLAISADGQRAAW